MDKKPVVRIYRDPSNELLSSREWIIGSGLSFFIISSGSLTSVVNHASYFVSDQNIMILPEGLSINSIEANDDFKGYLITFDSEFMDRIYSSGFMTWKRSGVPVVNRMSKEEAKLYKSYISVLSDSLSEVGKRNEEVSWLLAKAFVIAVLGKDNDLPAVEEDTRSRADIIANRFIRLVEQFGTSHRDLEFYADKLCITPKYLSHVISKTTGKKALKWIEDFVVAQAMHKLKTTDLNVNQISDSLNFLAPSDFCRTFRKNTGMTPLAYRKSNS